jgi:chaperonin GroES
MAAKSRQKKVELQPTAGYVLVEPFEATQKTDSGIYLPDTAEPDKPQKGHVLAVGPDEVLDSGKTRKSPVKKGDVVIYKKWGGSEVKIDAKEYLFAKFEDILAIEK